MTKQQRRMMAYCTNVHAGADLSSTVANLQQHATAVKARAWAAEPMGIGLWLSSIAARQLIESGQGAQLAGWLAHRELVPITMNGFPFGDFHQAVVKHQVYEPTWCEPARVDYTRDLVAILDAILPDGLEGSISTLPIAWNRPALSDRQLAVAAENLRQLAAEMQQLEQETGRLIYLCLEPEPGCVLQRSEDVVRFFRDYLLSVDNPDPIRRHLRVCHDVCHAAVMFEDQRAAFQAYADQEILVGKIQVSSAIELDFNHVEPAQGASALQQLSAFAEDRYLHQTVVESAVGGATRFYEDLPSAIAQSGQHGLSGTRWRVHFHMPIYLEQFGTLGTTRSEILRCLDAAAGQAARCHVEIETYAWQVLPKALQQPELASGIADEMLWLSRQPSYQQLWQAD